MGLYGYTLYGYTYTVYYRIESLQNPLTKPGIWCVMMKAAASLCNLFCRFTDELSAGGNVIPMQKDIKCIAKMKVNDLNF